MKLSRFVLCALGALALSGCQYTISMNAKFVLKGKVMDSYGRPTPINSSDLVDLCVDFDYEVLGQQGRRERLERSVANCIRIVTNGQGEYASTVLASDWLISVAKEAERMVIHTPQVYGRLTRGQQIFLLPVTSEPAKMDASGGEITANIPLPYKLR